jgi:hypothetical protein
MMAAKTVRMTIMMGHPLSQNVSGPFKGKQHTDTHRESTKR